MDAINILTVETDAGTVANINKALIFSIEEAEHDEVLGFRPITILSALGGEIHLSPDEDYNDLIRRWTS